MTVKRDFPSISDNYPFPKRPISFICVQFSDEFDHNILTSECVHDKLNEFIVVDNRGNVFFETLGQAINAGIARAQHELIVIVHEDVVFPSGWQSMFEVSLTALEQHDSAWLVAGVVGWDDDERLIGHSSDPHGYRNTFTSEKFALAARIDEQVIILRKSKGLFPDPNLPGIHNIGRDLAWSASELGGDMYVINAPSIHKYMDAGGNLIIELSDSEKIRNRAELTFIHNKKCSDEYLAHKWKRACDTDISDLPALSDQQEQNLISPIILLGRGGSGTRLMSVMAADANLFIGNENSPAGDCLEMVGAIYRAIYRKYHCPNGWQKTLIVSDLRNSAAKMLARGKWPFLWAFKLPESLLILPEIRAAFPKARYAFLKRDPLATVLRRTHMTARLDNEVGRIALPLAYDFANLPREQLLRDDAIAHMARTTAHQLALAMEFREQISIDNWFDVDFEQLTDAASSMLVEFAHFCGTTVTSDHLVQTIDPNRLGKYDGSFSEDTIKMASNILLPIRNQMGYQE